MSHRLELRKFFYIFFCCTFISLARYKEEIRVFLISDMHVRNKKYVNFVLIFKICMCEKRNTGISSRYFRYACAKKEIREFRLDI